MAKTSGQVLAEIASMLEYLADRGETEITDTEPHVRYTDVASIDRLVVKYGRKRFVVTVAESK